MRVLAALMVLGGAWAMLAERAPQATSHVGVALTMKEMSIRVGTLPCTKGKGQKAEKDSPTVCEVTAIAANCVPELLGGVVIGCDAAKSNDGATKCDGIKDSVSDDKEGAYSFTKGDCAAMYAKSTCTTKVRFGIICYAKLTMEKCGSINSRKSLCQVAPQVGGGRDLEPAQTNRVSLLNTGAKPAGCPIAPVGGAFAGQGISQTCSNNGPGRPGILPSSRHAIAHLALIYTPQVAVLGDLLLPPRGTRPAACG